MPASANLSFKKWINIINQACQGGALLDLAANLAKYHRVQASPGYAGAADFVAEFLQEQGVKVSSLSYPADGSSFSFTQKMFKEWTCHEGWLELTTPWTERLADFRYEELALIQRSVAKDYANKPVPIIYVDDLVKPWEFDHSLEGALLFVENNFANWVTRASELGALGLITVSIPETKPVRKNLSRDLDLAEVHANLNFGVYNEKQETGLCGFALTPKAGEKLRQACQELSLEGQRPMACFKVVAEFTVSTQKNIEAVIPGQLAEEVLLVAHLCHPRNSVNDNLSGVVASLQALTVLNKLIADGKLKQPRRTIRLLLMPEFTGTYAFLHANEQRLSQIKAGLNLDLVAGRQDGKAGLNLIVDTPAASCSFVGDLASLIADHLACDCPFGGLGKLIPFAPILKVPFAGGSDHYILADPTINIPTVALTQWPDKFYHTSGDQLERLDPQLLERAAALAAAYAYLLANLDLETSTLILQETALRFAQNILELRWLSPASELQERAKYLQELYLGTLTNLLNLVQPEAKKELNALIEIEQEHAKALINLVAGESALENRQEDSPIPLRLFKAPLAEKSLEADLPPAKLTFLEELRREHPSLRATADLLLYEADGQKTVAEIVRRVYFQTELDATAYALAYFQFLADINLIKFIS